MNIDCERRTALLSMVMLYGSRSAAVVVGFFFLPLYHRLLGNEQFGLVAVILSLQALLMMLDLGMSTLVGREVASGEKHGNELYRLVHEAELGLGLFYLVLLLLAVAAKAAGGFPNLDFVTVIGILALFSVLVLQNLYYSVMMATRAYSKASTVQVAGVVLRAVFTALVLANIQADLRIFVAVQFVTGSVHWLVTRRTMKLQLFSGGATTSDRLEGATLGEVLSLLKRGRSLALFSAAGAAAMQLDKPIVSAFASAASVSPYFLATTLCMAPISLLAGPVSQYFQPLVFAAGTRRDGASVEKILSAFSICLVLVTMSVSASLWMLRQPIVGLWLGHNNPDHRVVADYVAILLPGVAFGALGYLPYTLLLSVRDYKFQAVLSWFSTILTVTATAVCAWQKNIAGVCYVYLLYHSGTTFLSWLRAWILPATRAQAKLTFCIAMLLTATTAILCLCIALIRTLTSI